MISHEYQCIFVHIPKCAGTSVENALGHFKGHTGRGGQDHRSIRLIEQPLVNSNLFSSPENLSEVIERIRHQYRSGMNPRNKLTVTKEQYKRYYKFTFIRNPWSRAYSWYKNVIRDDIHKKNDRVTQHLSLNEFLKRYSGKGMLRPQTYWLKDFSGSIPLDYIGRFESLVEDFQTVCRSMHIPQLELAHEIKGTGEDYRQYYDHESINLVMEVYQEEIELFGYSFD